MLKHLLFLFFVILLLVIFALSEETHYQVVDGYWTGKVEMKDSNIHVAFNLSWDGCEFDCPEQNAYGVTTEVLYRNHESICFYIPSLNAHARLATDKKGGTLSGVFRQGGKTYPLQIRLNDIKTRRRP